MNANPVNQAPQPKPEPTKRHGKPRDLRVNTTKQGPPSDDAVRGDQRRPVNRAARALNDNNDTNNEVTR